MAVISFLIITGYTTELMLDKNEGKNVWKFYRKRLARIYPQYWFYMVLTIIIVFGFGLWHETLSELSGKGLVYNLLLIPLNYTYLPSVSLAMTKCLVIPAAWTIGLQMVWWLVSPLYRWLISNNKFGEKFYWITLIGSGAIFVSSILGYIPSMYSYNNILGMFWIFAIGRLIRLDKRYALGCIWTIDLFLTLILSYYPQKINGLNNAVVVGILFAIPIVLLLKSWNRNKIDNFMGAVSYGVYLNHFTIKEILVNIIHREPSGMLDWGVLIMLSTLVSIIVCCMENKICNRNKARLILQEK